MRTASALSHRFEGMRAGIRASATSKQGGKKNKKRREGLTPEGVSHRIEVRDRSTKAEIAACLNAAGGDLFLEFCLV